MIVVDASAAISALLRRGQARSQLAGQQVHVPHLVDSEIANALRQRVGAGDVRVDLLRAWELRDNLSAYDASCIALAESLDCGMVTADVRLARAVWRPLRDHRGASMTDPVRA